MDLLRTQSETKVQCTHWQTTGHSRVGTRIDYIFIDPALDSLFSPLEASICPFTDHLSLSTSLKVHSNAPHGASTWKFNTSLLQSDLFRSAVEKLWHELQDNPLNTTQETWEEAKSLFQGLATHHALLLKRISLRQFSSLQHTLLTLEYKIANHSSPPPILLKERLDTLAQLSSKAQSSFEGLRIRARAKWLEE